MRAWFRARVGHITDGGPASVRLTFFALVCLVAPCDAQVPGAMGIGYVYPAGAPCGQELTVTIGGQGLKGVKRAHVSGEGVQATVVSFNEPLSRKEVQELQTQLRNLEKRKRAALDAEKRRLSKPAMAAAANVPPWTEADERALAAVMAKLAKSAKVRRPASPAIADTIIVRVTVAQDAKPGEREIRLAADNALSNPLVFCLGTLPEFSEEVAGTSPETPAPKKPEYRGQPPPRELPGEIPALPAVINGQITARDVDRWRFEAKKGQRLVIAAKARALIPYIADAVPGWFQAALVLYDPRGREIAFDDDFHLQPDPVLSYEIREDGAYEIEIRDALYRGREDFIYRITIGELPFLTGLFPLGGRAGETTTVSLSGWNLAEKQLGVAPGKDGPEIRAISVQKDALASNAEPFAIDTLPEEFEKESRQPQRLKMPVIVNGRIDVPGDVDTFSFEGVAGQEWVAEVRARRLESPLDSILELRDASGGRVAFNDDFEDKGLGVDTHHADSFLMVKLPRSGIYNVHLRDVQDKGGHDFSYRLRMGAPRPDFALRVVPSGINMQPGATTPLTVYALRKDGFAGEIVLSLGESANGFALGGGRIPVGQAHVRLTLTAPSSPLPDPVTLALHGTAKIGERVIRRAAIPADDRMQAFAYRHLVPAKELKVAVSGKAVGRGTIDVQVDGPVEIPVGGVARIPFSAPPGSVFPRGKLELDDPLEGFSIESIVPSRAGAEIIIRTDAQKLKPGLEGNLILSTFAGAPAPGRRRAALATLPAVPFRLIGR